MLTPNYRSSDYAKGRGLFNSRLYFSENDYAGHGYKPRGTRGKAQRHKQGHRTMMLNHFHFNYPVGDWTKATIFNKVHKSLTRICEMNKQSYVERTNIIMVDFYDMYHDAAN